MKVRSHCSNANHYQPPCQYSSPPSSLTISSLWRKIQLKQQPSSIKQLLKKQYESSDNQQHLCRILNVPSQHGPVMLNEIPKTLINKVTDPVQAISQILHLFQYLSNTRGNYVAWVIYYHQELQIFSVKLLKEFEIDQNIGLLNMTTNCIGFFIGKCERKISVKTQAEVVSMQNSFDSSIEVGPKEKRKRKAKKFHETGLQQHSTNTSWTTENGFQNKMKKYPKDKPSKSSAYTDNQYQLKVEKKHKRENASNLDFKLKSISNKECKVTRKGPNFRSQELLFKQTEMLKQSDMIKTTSPQPFKSATHVKRRNSATTKVTQELRTKKKAPSIAISDLIDTAKKPKKLRRPSKADRSPKEYIVINEEFHDRPKESDNMISIKPFRKKNLAAVGITKPV